MLYRRRGYDSQLFTKSPAFAAFPKPTIPLSSPDCGPSNSKLTKDYSMFGAGKMPELKWATPPPEMDVKEYLLISEDVDAPMGHPNVHGIYCGIPATTTELSAKDFEVEREEGVRKVLKSGFRVGKNRRNVVYIPCRPPLGHGPHRYFFELVALKEKLDEGVMSEVPTKEEVLKLVEGKVAGWGLWIGTYESVWE